MNHKLLNPPTNKIFKWVFRRTSAGAAVCPRITESPCRPCVPDVLAVELSCMKPKVLILGAGIAGLSAAERLVQCGVNDVTILEALPRPGGRIFTEVVDGVAMDLGPTWITGGSPENTVFSLACQDRILLPPVVRSRRENAMAFNSSGKVFQKHVSVAAHKIFKDIIARCKERAGKERMALDLWTYLGKEIDSVLKYFPERDRAAARCIMDSLTLETRNNFGSELSCVPLAKYGLLKELPGGNVSVKKGMASILSPLLRTVDNSKIKYNTVARKISWGKITPGDLRINVNTCDGQIFKADYVIVAMPLGVLKCYNHEMFEPPLPMKKQEAIKKIGRGYMSNICLRFKKPFWISDDGGIRTCWGREEIMLGDHWTKSVSLIEPLPTTDDTLCIQLSGSAAAQVETLSDCQVLQDATRLIRRFLGNPSIPMPSHIVRSKWNTHPRFLGATSFLGLESFQSDIQEYANPIPEDEIAPSVLFAGEATTPGFQGTAHGARLSGIREAERILYYTKCFCGPPPKPPRTCN